MKILLASSEVYPYSKTGGLADMVGALGRSLAQAGHEAAIVTPLYPGIVERNPGLKRAVEGMEFQQDADRVKCDLWVLKPARGLRVYFVDQPIFFNRRELYTQYGVDYPDNAARFVFFSKAIRHVSLNLDWKPQVVHLHDWQAGLAALLLHHERKTPANGPRVCMTIHNLAFQGLFPPSQYPLTNLPWHYFNSEGIEFYGKFSCLKAGIVFADVITTVSPRYAREILTQEYGCGLDGLLRNRQHVLSGVLNGADYSEWDSLNDPFLPRPFSVEDFEGKQANKLALQAELGLPVDPDVPLFGNIGRLAEQKGVDLLVGALGQMVGENLQFVLLGSGSPALQGAVERLAREFPAKIAVRIGFDEKLAHRIEAGADFFVMPSRFEPCGLNQLYSLRYGAVPIVRATGGLDDTVVDVRQDSARATGIKFSDHSVAALVKAFQKALALYREPGLLEHFRRNGMLADFSWERTAAEYLRVYEKALATQKGEP